MSERKAKEAIKTQNFSENEIKCNLQIQFYIKSCSQQVKYNVMNLSGQYYIRTMSQKMQNQAIGAITIVLSS